MAEGLCERLRNALITTIDMGGYDFEPTGDAADELAKQAALAVARWLTDEARFLQSAAERAETPTGRTVLIVKVDALRHCADMINAEVDHA